MKETSDLIRTRDFEAAIHRRILERAGVINEKLLSRLGTVAQDIDEGNFRDAITCLGGLEKRIYAMRSLLFLLS